MNTDDTNRRQWARQAILLVITCVVLAAAMLLIRAYVFTIYSDSQTGERVIVNRIDRNDFSKGDKVVYTENGVPFMGYVSAIPGDTVTLQGNKYQIRQRCVCNGTECDNCRYYLVESGDKEALVNHKRMVGKAYKLW